jgi:hypothetical protein
MKHFGHMQIFSGALDHSFNVESDITMQVAFGMLSHLKEDRLINIALPILRPRSSLGVVQLLDLFNNSWAAVTSDSFTPGDLRAV